MRGVSRSSLEPRALFRRFGAIITLVGIFRICRVSSGKNLFSRREILRHLRLADKVCTYCITMLIILVKFSDYGNLPIVIKYIYCKNFPSRKTISMA